MGAAETELAAKTKEAEKGKRENGKLNASGDESSGRETAQGGRWWTNAAASSLVELERQVWADPRDAHDKRVERLGEAGASELDPPQERLGVRDGRAARVHGARGDPGRRLGASHRMVAAPR